MGGDPARGAAQDGDLPRVVGGADRFVPGADGEVVEAVVVEVTGGKGGAPVVAGLAAAEAGEGGCQRPVGGVGRAVGGAEEDEHRAGVGGSAAARVVDAFAVSPHGDVVEAVVVEVPHRQRGAEQVARLVGDGGGVVPRPQVVVDGRGGGG